MHIVVIGTGYVGLVAGACFAELGMNVTCIDQDQNKVANLQIGKIHIYEPGLEEIVINNLQSGSLAFSYDKQLLSSADLILVAVGTPARTDGSANLSYLEQAIEDIKLYCPQGGMPVMIKSTVPVGTAKMVVEKLGDGFEVISNPEFLREGSAVEDFMKPERLVIGGTKAGAAIASILYKKLSDRDVPILYTDNQTAELIKYTSNCYLAMRLAFLNEISDIAEAAEANIEHIAEGIGMDSRIGSKYLKAGPGFGGSCFPKDTMALSYMAHKYGRPSQILDATIKANYDRKRLMVDKIKSALGSDLAGKKCAILGLTFKAKTDDVRDSASLDIITALLDAGVVISCYDPKGMDEAKKVFNDSIIYNTTPYAAAEAADVAVILTEWEEFASLDIIKLLSKMKSSVIVDFRNMYSLQEMEGFDVEYTSLGRPKIFGVKK